MSQQLSLRVSVEFANRLECLSKKTGRSMAAVLEAVAGQALAIAEADIEFAEQSLKAKQAYEMTGVRMSAEEIDAMFDNAIKKAYLVVKGAR